MEKEYLKINEENSVETPNKGSDMGISTLIINLINDEWEAVQGYNDFIANADANKYGDLINIMKDIASEEMIHIGQLEMALKTISPNVENIDSGIEEANIDLGESVKTSINTSELEESCRKYLRYHKI